MRTLRRLQRETTVKSLYVFVSERGAPLTLPAISTWRDILPKPEACELTVHVRRRCKPHPHGDMIAASPAKAVSRAPVAERPVALPPVSPKGKERRRAPELERTAAAKPKLSVRLNRSRPRPSPVLLGMTIFRDLILTVCIAIGFVDAVDSLMVMGLGRER
jgi:hypothetical protein